MVITGDMQWCVMFQTCPVVMNQDHPYVFRHPSKWPHAAVEPGRVPQRRLPTPEWLGCKNSHFLSDSNQNDHLEGLNKFWPLGTGKNRRHLIPQRCLPGSGMDSSPAQKTSAVTGIGISHCLLQLSLRCITCHHHWGLTSITSRPYSCFHCHQSFTGCNGLGIVSTDMIYQPWTRRRLATKPGLGIGLVR